MSRHDRPLQQFVSFHLSRHDDLPYDMFRTGITIKYLLLDSSKVNLRQINHPDLPIPHGVKVILSIRQVSCDCDLRRTFKVARKLICLCSYADRDIEVVKYSERFEHCII